MYIKRLASGNVQITVSKGSDINGKRIRETYTVKSTEFVETLHDYFGRYVEMNDGVIADSTLSNFIKFYNRYVLNSPLASKRLGDITVRDINSWVSMYLVKNSALKDTTKKKYFKMLSAFINQAVYEEYLVSNPCSKARPLKVNSDITTTETFTLKEVQYILSVINRFDKTTELFCRIAFSTGARLNEIRRLRISDFDIKNSTVHIRGTKTSSSDRIVPVPQDLIGRVFKLHSDVSDERLFVSSKSGSLYTTDGLRKKFYKVLEELGLPKRKVHAIRHTYATLLITVGGVDVYTCAKFLGHSNPMMTLKRYTHLSEEATNSVRDFIGSF